MLAEPVAKNGATELQMLRRVTVSTTSTASEHWLWPYKLSTLDRLHPEFSYTAVADERLGPTSDLTRGCGGVAILWKKTLRFSPITAIVSDRICGIRLFLMNSAEWLPRDIHAQFRASPRVLPKLSRISWTANRSVWCRWTPPAFWWSKCPFGMQRLCQPNHCYWSQGRAMEQSHF